MSGNEPIRNGYAASIIIPRAVDGDVNEIGSSGEIKYSGGVDGQSLWEGKFTCNQRFTESESGVVKVGGKLETNIPYIFECSIPGREVKTYEVVFSGDEYQTIYVDNGNYRRIRDIGLFGKKNYFPETKDNYEYKIALVDGEIKARIHDVGNVCKLVPKMLGAFCGEYTKPIEIGPLNGGVNQVPRQFEGPLGGMSKSPSGDLISVSFSRLGICVGKEVIGRIWTSDTKCDLSGICPINKYSKTFAGEKYQAQWQEVKCNIKEIPPAEAVQ